MSYFRAFPNVEYRFTDKVSKIYKNISLRPTVVKELFGSPSNLESYSVQDGETPETIAFDRYGEVTFHWVIMLANNVHNLYNDWPKTEKVLNQYIIEKYRVQTDSDGVQRTLTDTQTQELIDFVGTPANNYNSDINLQDSENSPKVVIRPIHFKDLDGDIYSYDSISVTVDAFGRSITKPTLIPVSHFEYEFDLNEEKRNILLPYPETARRIDKELRGLLGGR